MFTGIIQQIGTIISISRNSSGARLSVDIGKLAYDVKLGGSVAINGACLSAVAKSGQIIEFDVVAETLSRTNIGNLRASDRVNIELSLKVSDRLEGHFVLGHVDTTACIVAINESGVGKRMQFKLFDADYMKYIIPKGSIAIDGISLTIADVDFSSDVFSVAVIPVTLTDTTLGNKSIGDILNIETDILVKAVIYNQSKMFDETDTNEKLSALLKQSGFIR